MSDYYKILGVNKDAKADEIKKSYRKLALQYHPDRNAGDKQAEEQFKKISEAYAVLSDADKRRQYDTFGSSNFHQRYSQEDIFRNADFETIFADMGFGGRGGSGGGSGGGSFESIFGRMFQGFGGGGQQQQRAAKGQDIEYELTIAFEEAYHGCTRQVTLRIPGEGGDQALKVTIPAGIADGGKLRLAGKGRPGSAGAGDLFVLVRVAAHPHYKRMDRDIETPLSLKLSELLEGIVAEVTTLEGVRRIRVPAGVKPGTKLRLRELGFSDPQKRSPRGDFYALIEVDLPKELNAEQQAVLAEMKRVGL